MQGQSVPSPSDRSRIQFPVTAPRCLQSRACRADLLRARLVSRINGHRENDLAKSASLSMSRSSSGGATKSRASRNKAPAPRSPDVTSNLGQKLRGKSTGGSVMMPLLEAHNPPCVAISVKCSCVTNGMSASTISKAAAWVCSAAATARCNECACPLSGATFSTIAKSSAAYCCDMGAVLAHIAKCHPKPKGASVRATCVPSGVPFSGTISLSEPNRVARPAASTATAILAHSIVERPQYAASNR